MFTSSLYVVELVVGVGLLIFIHELGHFIAAKSFGITVPVFSLGFGPRLFGFNWRGTDCRVSLLPLGGYVMLPGEIPEEGKSGDPAQLSNRPVWQRVVVFSAGVTMNVVLSLVLFVVALSIGVPFPQPVIGEVAPDTPAAHAGLQRGDRVVAIDGRQNVDLEDLLTTIALSGKGQSIDLTVLRYGATFDVSVTPEKEPDAGLPTIGIIPASDTTIVQVESDSTAAKAGLRPGDKIESLDGLPVFDNTDVETYVGARPDADIAVGLLRDGEPIQKTLHTDHAFTLDAGLAPAELLAIKSVFPDTPAARAGLLPGDRILAVDNLPIFSYSRVVLLIALNPDKPLPWLIKRGDTQLTLDLAARRKPYTLQPSVGVGFGNDQSAVVGAVAPDSPLAQAGLRSGDRILSVNGKDLDNWSQLEGILLNLATDPKKASLPVKFSWKATGETVTKSVTLKRVPLLWAAGDLGIAVRGAQMKVSQYPLLQAPAVGIQKTVVFIERLYLLVRSIGQHRVAPGKALGGPVRIFQIAWQAASVGPTYFIYFLAIIGLNLAVFNFLPVPFLDGGHVTLTLLEKLRGKPLKPRTYEIVSYVGLALVLALAVVLTYNDLRRVIFGG